MSFSSLYTIISDKLAIRYFLWSARASANRKSECHNADIDLVWQNICSSISHGHIFLDSRRAEEQHGYPLNYFPLQDGPRSEMNKPVLVNRHFLEQDTISIVAYNPWYMPISLIVLYVWGNIYRATGITPLDLTSSSQCRIGAMRNHDKIPICITMLKNP